MVSRRVGYARRVQPPRSLDRRMQDSLARLLRDDDAWVSTADGRGVPHLVPLSFLWADDVMWLATASSSPTARNLVERGRVRVALGTTRDVVMIDGTADRFAVGDVSPAVADAFFAKVGFDPRTLSTAFAYFRVRPERIQAWRESNEISGRDLMRDGVWSISER